MRDLHILRYMVADYHQAAAELRELADFARTHPVPVDVHVALRLAIGEVEARGQLLEFALGALTSGERPAGQDRIP